MVNPSDSQQVTQKEQGKASWVQRFWRRGLRLIGKLVLTLLVVVLVLLLVVTLPATRSGLLKMALGQAHRFLPGELTVTKASWPQPGRLEFQGIVWRVAVSDSLSGAAVGDTLAQIADLVVELDLMALRDKDLWVREVILQAGPVDIPNIIKLFPVSETASAETDSLPPALFLREGNFPPIPSIGLEKFKVQVRDLEVDETLTVASAGLEGFVDLRAGSQAEVQLKRGAVRLELSQDDPMILVADSLMVSLTANGPDREFILENLFLRVPEAGPIAVLESWRDAETVSLHISGQGKWTETGLNIALAGSGVLPGPDHLRPLLPEDVPLEVSGPLVGDFDLDVSIADFYQPDPVAHVRLDFSDTPWLEHLILTAGVENFKVEVDTFDLVLMGARLAASGWVDSTEVDMILAAGLDDPTLLHLLGGPALATAEANFDLKADLKGLWPLPGLNLDLTASANTPDLVLPSLHTEIRTRNHLVEARILVDQGLTSGAATLDSLQLNWEADLSRLDSLSHRFDLGVWAPMGRVALGGTGLIDSVRTLKLDSLVIVGLDSTMRTQQPATILLGPGPRDLRVENFRLEGGLGIIALQCQLDSTGLNLDLTTDLLLREEFLMAVAPSDFWGREGGSDVSIKASVDLEGGAGGPVFNGQAGARLIPHRDDPEVGVELDFHLVRGDSSGLGADMLLFAGETNLLTGRFRWPGQPDMDTGQWIPEPGRGLEVLFSHQELDLSLLNPVLPPDIKLMGILEFAAQLLEQTEPVKEDTQLPQTAFLSGASIEGHLGFEKLDVELPNSSRLALRMNTDLSGNVFDPEIKGTVEIMSGYIRIPEIPPTLLPLEGESLIWQAMVKRAAAQGDSISVEDYLNPDNQGPMMDEATGAFVPNLDLTLDLPGNLIINGYGLNIELEGSLQATRGQDEEGIPVPILNGRIGVRQGTLKFMNNVFDVEKADINFNNLAPPNPHLDIKLSSDVSGYIIYLKVTGFADDPDVELSSEPDLVQSDIVAVLLFGQPTNDLDNNQRGQADKENDPGVQLRENLAALAVVFGGAGLQNKMSNTLGVDLVEMGSDSEGDSTFRVGKYLTPKILLDYNQSLEKSGTYFMTLEYSINKYFKLISTYGQGEEASGLELKWLRRY